MFRCNLYNNYCICVSLKPGRSRVTPLVFHYTPNSYDNIELCYITGKYYYFAIHLIQLFAVAEISKMYKCLFYFFFILRQCSICGLVQSPFLLFMDVTGSIFSLLCCSVLARIEKFSNLPVINFFYSYQNKRPVIFAGYLGRQNARESTQISSLTRNY